MNGCQWNVRAGVVALVVLRIGCAQGEAKAPDLGSAKASLPAAVPALAAHGDGWGFRRSPDGTRWAWFEAGDCATLSAPGPRALDLCVAVAGRDRIERFAVHAAAQWPDYSSAGPEWLPNSLAVAVGYSIEGENHASFACVDVVDLVARKAANVLRVAGSRIDSIAVAPRCERLAIMVAGDFAKPGDPTSYRGPFLHCAGFDGGAPTRRECKGKRSYANAASWSPDEKTLAIVTGAGLWFAPAGDGEPEYCCAVGEASVSMDHPVWVQDGTAVVVAAAGSVLHAGPKQGLLHIWTPVELGGRAVAAVLRPEAGVAAAVVSVPLKRETLEVHLLSLVDGAHLRVADLIAKVADRGRRTMPYTPRITELLQ